MTQMILLFVLMLFVLWLGSRHGGLALLEGKLISKNYKFKKNS